jgi:hypothetical protein
VGDELYIYYRGFGVRHAGMLRQMDTRLALDDGRPDDTPHTYIPTEPRWPSLPTPAVSALGLATIRLDGFASVNASYEGGTLTTSPIEFTTDQLSVNVKADFGRIFVELLNEDDEPVPGYSKEEAVPIEENHVAASVAWKERRSLTELEGQAVKIRFHLVNARLYSYACR